MKIIETPCPFPILSYRDLGPWCQLLHSKLSACRVDRVFVPLNPSHRDGFLKRTVVIELTSRTQSFQLYLSLRPQECGILLLPGKTLRPNPNASRSGFELNLAKTLPGSILASIQSVPGDRIAVFEFKSTEKIELHLNLIPGRPSGTLLTGAHAMVPPPRILTPEQEAKIPSHPEWIASIEGYAHRFHEAERHALLLLRIRKIIQSVATDLASVQNKLNSLESQKTQSEQEEDWSYFGSILKTHLYEKPKPKDGAYFLLDYEKNEDVRIPANPKRSAEEQLTHFFHLAKRKKKRIQDSHERIESLLEKQKNLESIRFRCESCETENELSSIESELGITLGKPNLLPSKERSKIADFTGREVQSQEGLTILAGRNSAENLQLTFKIARGNDIWLHVKGRPGSHTVILIPPKRSASLDTLLDAAHLCILHSGGKDWGKTEVDYTFRKHVKKIKNQTEVTYTQNKTLSVVLDDERVKRLSSS